MKKTILFAVLATVMANRRFSHFSIGLRKSNVLRTTALFGCLVGCAFPSAVQALGCDGEWYVTVWASNTNLSILDTNNTASLVFHAGGAPTTVQLGLSYTGTATNGVDVELLPTSVTIPAGQTASLTVKPKANYPFGVKTLTVTIVSCVGQCVLIGPSYTASVTLNGFQAPFLRVPQISGSNLFLSWSVPVTGYVLQERSMPFGNSDVWVDVSNAPAITQGTNYSLTLPINIYTNTFYRLKKP